MKDSGPGKKRGSRNNSKSPKKEMTPGHKFRRMKTYSYEKYGKPKVEP
jgi:hypothetical protein